MTEKEAVEKAKAIPGFIEKVKSLFSQMEELPAVKLSEVKLKDGTILIIEGDVPAEKAGVQVKSDTGNVDAQDGDYELEDGTKITVAGGKISKLTAPEKKVVAELPVQMNTEDFNTAIKSLTDRIEALEKKAGEGEVNLSEANAVIEKQKTELSAQKEILKETFSLVETLSNLPANSPVESVKKIDFSHEDRMEALAKQLKELKKV